MTQSEQDHSEAIEREFAMRLLAQNIGHYSRDNLSAAMSERIGEQFHRHLRWNLEANTNAMRAAKIASKYNADPIVVYAIIFDTFRCLYSSRETYPVLLDDVSWVTLERPE